MSTTTVVYSLDDPSAVTISDARVAVRLMPGTVRGDLAAGGVVAGDATVRTTTAGAWQVPLIPNAEYRTAGTWYQVRIVAPAVRVEYAIVVPVSAGAVSLWACIVDPDTLVPVPPEVPGLYVLRAEAGAPLGVATLDADGRLPAAQLPVGVNGGGGGGVTDHGALTGLADDDHAQYLTQGRGDTRYAPVAHQHPVSDVTGLAAVATTGAYGDLSGRPAIPDSPDDIGAAAAAHGHVIGEVTGLAAALAGTVQASLVDAKGDLYAGTAADTVARLAVGSDGQVLTADSGAAAGLSWTTPAGGAAVDLVAATYGCKALTFGPVGVGGNATQEIRIAQDRSIVCRLALPAGTLVSGIRLPVAGLTSTGGDLFGTVYHADGSVLDTTADVSGALSTGSAQVWRDIPLPTPDELAGDHLYVALTNTVPTGESLQIVICQFDGAGAVPLWLFDGAAFRLDGVTAPPNPLVPASGTAYWAPCIGIY